MGAWDTAWDANDETQDTLTVIVHNYAEDVIRDADALLYMKTHKEPENDLLLHIDKLRESIGIFMRIADALKLQFILSEEEVKVFNRAVRAAKKIASQGNPTNSIWRDYQKWNTTVQAELDAFSGWLKTKDCIR